MEKLLNKLIALRKKLEECIKELEDKKSGSRIDQLDFTSEPLIVNNGASLDQIFEAINKHIETYSSAPCYLLMSQSMLESLQRKNGHPLVELFGVKIKTFYPTAKETH